MVDLLLGSVQFTFMHVTPYAETLLVIERILVILMPVNRFRTYFQNSTGFILLFIFGIYCSLITYRVFNPIQTLNLECKSFNAFMNNFWVKLDFLIVRFYRMKQKITIFYLF